MFGLGESDKNNDMMELSVMWLYLSRAKLCLLCWVDVRGSRVANMGHRAEAAWKEKSYSRSLTALWKDPRRNGIIGSFMMQTAICCHSNNVHKHRPGLLSAEIHGYHGVSPHHLLIFLWLL